KRHRHRTVLEYHFVGPFLDTHKLLRSDRCSREFHGSRVVAKVNAHGMQIEQLGEHSGKQMLAGVLLHKVEAAYPVDLARDAARRDGSGEYMGDPVAFVDYVLHRNAAQPA